MDYKRLPITADAERGKRLCEILQILSGGANNPTARAKFIGEEQSKYRRYEAGANIPNELLGKIASMGGDVVYILTGVRSTPSPAPAGHTGDAPHGSSCPPFVPSENAATNVARLLLEVESNIRAIGLPDPTFDALLGRLTPTLTRLRLGTFLALQKKQAEEQAQKSQAG